MIIRTWHGCVPKKQAEAFAEHLEVTGVKHAKSVPGNKGVFVKRLTHGKFEHFFMATYWESLKDVIAFAGEDYTQAVHYPYDAAFGLIPDPYVFHHEVESIRPL